MPTVLRSGPFRFFFFSCDGDEPPQIHVERDDCEAKFWLDPIQIDRSHGFRGKEIRRVLHMVEKHQWHLLEAWNEFFHG